MGNVDTVKALYDAFATGDVPAVLNAMDPAIRWNEAEGVPYGQGGGEPWIGPDAVAQNLFARLGAEWSPFVVTPQRLYGDGDSVVVEGRYTGKFNATGADLDAQFCHVFKVADGKITSFQQYTDTAQFQKVMNAVPV
jgi:hypothetical protein